MMAEKDRPSRSPQKGCNPVFINALTYIGTMAAFLVAVFVKEIKLHYFPATGCLVPGPTDSTFAQEKNIKYLFIGLWELHFLRRTIEVLFVHDYKRKMSFTESLGAPLYYWFFAFWNGVAIRSDNGYNPTYLPMASVGGVLFIVGEFGNCYCHYLLRSFRKAKRRSFLSKESKHVIPSGFLFELVSCPHYFFEIVTWVGFLLTTWTLAAVVFLSASAITLFIYAHKKHKAYVMEFDGLAGRDLYPRNRKALIPFLF